MKFSKRRALISAISVASLGLAACSGTDHQLGQAAGGTGGSGNFAGTLGQSGSAGSVAQGGNGGSLTQGGDGGAITQGGDGGSITRGGSGGSSPIGGSSNGGHANGGSPNGGAGGSLDFYSCDATTVQCSAAAPTCPSGEVPSVGSMDGLCWSGCVPIANCLCTAEAQCPPSGGRYFCDTHAGHCAQHGLGGGGTSSGGASGAGNAGMSGG